MGKRKSIVVLSAFVLLIGCKGEIMNDHSPALKKKQNQSSLTISSPTIDLIQLIDSLKINKNEIYMKVSKKNYRMEVIHDTVVLKTYPVVFGFNPLDDKFCQGDGCTPEGKFAIRSKYPHGSWSKFMWIDYPNKESWEKHYQAKKDGKIPKNKSIGGEVGIHGVPVGYDYMIDERENWTLGCISLKNKDVDELYACLGNRSYIIITK